MQQGTGSGRCPEWSGKFWELDGLGFMAIHVTDERRHKPPAGWSLEGTEFFDDSEMFVYSRKEAA